VGTWCAAPPNDSGNPRPKPAYPDLGTASLPKVTDKKIVTLLFCSEALQDPLVARSSIAAPQNGDFHGATKAELAVAEFAVDLSQIPCKVGSAWLPLASPPCAAPGAERIEYINKPHQPKAGWVILN
jgi:hypothetical protein